MSAPSFKVRSAPSKWSSWKEETKKRRFMKEFQLAAGPSEVMENAHSDQFQNMPVWLGNIDRLIKMSPSAPETSHFIDIGAGGGIALAYCATHYNFMSLTGIEHDPQTANTARRNLLKVGATLRDFTIECTDAAEVILQPVKSHLFLFNPFGKSTFTRMMENNQNALANTGSLMLLANDHLLETALHFGTLWERNKRFNLSVVKLD